MIHLISEIFNVICVHEYHFEVSKVVRLLAKEEKHNYNLELKLSAECQ